RSRAKNCCTRFTKPFSSRKLLVISEESDIALIAILSTPLQESVNGPRPITMIEPFRFSPSRLALTYIALSALVLALFAVPLWYEWSVNLSTFRAYVQG